MFLSNTFRIFSFCFFLLQFFTPPRYIPLKPAALYHIMVVSYMILSAFRIRCIFRLRILKFIVIGYASIPFFWTIWRYAEQAELLQIISSCSLGMLWIIGPLFLPVVLLMEFLQQRGADGSCDSEKGNPDSSPSPTLKTKS